MVKKHVLVPAEDVDPSTLKYEPQVFQAPHVTGWALKVFTRIVEAPVIGSLLIKRLKKKNKMDELLRNTVIPEAPMFQPQFLPQEPEQGVVLLDEDGKPQERVELALSCLPDYDPSTHWDGDSVSSFRYWKIRDYAHAYRSMLVTPSQVAERFISIIEDFNKKMPSMPLLVTFDADDVRRQASASTQRFKDGNAISILDGILIAIKDDIDCCPHPTKGGTTWLHEVRSVEGDAVTVSRLRSCGVVLVGKTNMHELGCGTTGNNANYGTPRNPHAVERYTGGSSSAPAAIVASGLCVAALGTDGGGSIRIPSSLCGVVGLKTTYGRVDTAGSLSDAGTVDILGPIASSVEDVLLVYAVILGSSLTDRINLRPSPPCLPNLQSTAGLGSVRLGKYTEWFNDVHSPDISVKCDDVLHLLSKANGCKVVDIVIPELLETRAAHLVTIGSEILYSATPDCEDGKDAKLTYDIRTFLAFFRSFNSSDYFAAQCLRRRIMYYYMEIFKKVDVIVTPTTGMTAPIIPPSAVKYGETDMQLTAYLMRYVVAANLLGLPAISIPVGYDKQGLPIGLQLIGRPWGEATILRLASAVEELCSKSTKQPAEFYDVLKVK